MDDRARFSAAAAVGAEKTYFSLSLFADEFLSVFARGRRKRRADSFFRGCSSKENDLQYGKRGYETTAAFLRFPIGRLRFSILFSLILITNKLMTINLLIILTEWFFSFSFFLTELLARAENATIRLVRDTLKRQRTSYSDSVCPFFR